MRNLTDIRRDVATALQNADVEALKRLSEEAAPEERYDRVEVKIHGLKACAKATTPRFRNQTPVTAETGVVEAVLLDMRAAETSEIDSHTIAWVIRHLNEAGDIRTLERLRDAIDLAPARYAGTMRWCVPGRDDDGTLIWTRETIDRSVMGSRPESATSNAEIVGRLMAASPELERAFELHAAQGGTFLADYAWGRAAREGVGSLKTADADRELREHARRTARQWRSRIGKPPVATETPDADQAFDETCFESDANVLMEHTDSEWADVLVGAGIAGDKKLIEQLAAAGLGAVTITEIDRGADLGDHPRAQVTIRRNTIESYDCVTSTKRFSYWTSWEEALDLATEELDEKAGAAFEIAMTEAPDKVSAQLRETLARGAPGSRRRSRDGFVELLVPAAGDEPWTGARRDAANARRAMLATPAITALAPHELRRRFAGNGSRGPGEILAAMSSAIDWADRYNIRRMILALMPEPGDNRVVDGPPRLAVQDGRLNGHVTATLESPAWAAHGLRTPMGAMPVSDALIVAGQTGTKLDQDVVQAAVDRLVWADDGSEVDRCAACLAHQPGIVDRSEEEPVRFHRMQARETATLYLNRYGATS